MFFLGESGIGKTEIAKSISDLYPICDYVEISYKQLIMADVFNILIAFWDNEQDVFQEQQIYWIKTDTDI